MASEGMDDQMGAISLTRTLRSTKTNEIQKFEAAKALWLIIQSSNLVGDDKLGVCAIAHEFWGFPWLLRSHCVTGLLDWAMNHVAGAQSQGSKVIKAQKMGNKEINLPIDEVSWEILAHILNEENLLPNGYAIPSSVLVGIAAQLKDVNARRHTVISNVARVMRALNTFKQQRNGKNVRTSWRLDHCVALATAALSMSDRSVCDKHRVAYNAVILLEGQTQSAVNLRKVWDALVPHHLPVFLIGAFSPALQWNEPLQTACRRVLKEILFAPEHLDSLQEAFDIEPERRSAIKTASYATQLLIQIDQLLGGDESLESTESVFLSLSWFLDEFSTAYNACSMTLEDKRGLLDPDSNREDETKGDSSRSKSDINPAFRCFETFSRSLMSIWMDRRAKDSDYDGELLLRSLASICLVLSRNRGIYRPMEDYTSKQRQCLSRIVTFALELPYKLNKTTGPGLGLDVVHAIVLVEHRDVQEHMGIIWSLLWKDVPEPPGLSIPRSVPLMTSSTQLAIALVKAHAELRQLEAMFDSLVSSMPPFGRVHMPIAFRRACKDAISSAPSGQSVSFVRMVGRWIEYSAGNNLENVAGLGHLCLCSVNCQLMTAPGIADACVQVIHALQTKVGQEVNGITPPVVVLYTEAVRVHQTCCRLHPKVISLHGQQAGSVETGGFFSVLLPKIGNDKSVWEHIQQWEGELLVAAGFHLQTLHQRILSARYDCCDVGIDVDGFKGSVDDGSKTRLVYESNVEEARYLARILVKHAGRLVFPIEGRGNEKTDIKMLNMLYVCFNSDTGDSFELMTPSDEDTGSGMPIAVRMAINLLVEEPSLLEAIVSKPVGLNDTKKLGAVAYNLVGRLLASKDDHDEEIVRQRLALFPEKDLTLSIAVGRWMRLLLSSIFSVARGNKGGKAAFNGDRKRKRDEKGEHDDMTSEMDAIQELCKQLTSERADRGELIVALKAVAAIGCKPLWTELRQRGVVSSSDTHSRTLLSCMNMAEKLVSILLAFEFKQSAAGQLCMVAGAGALVALLSLKFRHSQGEDVHETRLEPTSSRLLCNSISLLTREMQQVEMVGKRPLLHQKGLLSAFRDFLSVIMGPETVLDVVDRVRCLCQVLFTSTLIRFDGKPHYKAKTLKKLGALLISCRTSPVDGLLVTACAEACLSAVFKREQNKTDSFTEFIESVVNAIDMTLPTSLALRMEDNRMRSEEVPGTCYYNYHSYSYLSLAMAAGCVLQLRCALPLPSSPAVTRLPQDFKSVAETMCLLMSNGKKDLGSIGVLRQALAYVHGVCVITACMKPSASSHHFGSILCLLILFLHWLGHAMDPVPKLIPLTSIFPAASGEQTPGSVSELRGKALLAVHALISGASNQRVREVIRYAQNLLGGRCSGLNCLVASELLLMMLEAHGLCREHEHEHGMFNVQKDSVESTSSRNFNHALAQYGDRMACTLIRTLSVTSWAPLRGSPSEPDGEDSSEVNMNIRMGGVSYWQLCREYLKSTAHDIKSGADGGPCAGRLEWARAQVTPAPGWVVPVVPTTLRALESIVGRPKVFTNIPSRTFGRLVQCLSYTLPTGEFNHESGSVFVAICRLVLSLLRHREEAISPSMSEVARILGALLRWLIPNLCDSATSKNTVLLNDCSEVLGSVVVAFGSRGQSTAALCPNVLREYLLAQTRGNIQVLETSAIRYGAYALYGGSGAGGVEYLYATLGGHAAFQALAEVKAGYEAEYKYTGKV